MHALERHVLQSLRARALVGRDSRGLVCVSGGPDSLALLHVLHALSGPLGLRLEVLHGDHGLRPESAAEADWVVRQVTELGLPLHLLRATHLAALPGGMQAAARAWRRSEASRLAVQLDAHWIATGHQRDDHLETLLLKWLRGAHLTNLRGMAWRQGLFVRPLLDCKRDDLQAYLRALGQAWLEDPSNAKPAYRRNRVRHELRPLLDALTGGATERRLLALESQSAELAELLDWVQAAHPVPASDPDAGPEGHWLDVAALAVLPALAAGSVLHDFIVRRAPGAVEAAQVAQALGLLAGGAARWRLDLSNGRRLERHGARLTLHARPSVATVERWHTVGPWRVCAPAGWRVGPPARGTAGLTLHNLPPHAALHVRRRARGDRFQPAWRPHPVPLAAFLRDQHVPLHERDRLPLVLLEGQVIAVYPRFVAAGYGPPGPAEASLRLAIEPAG